MNDDSRRNVIIIIEDTDAYDGVKTVSVFINKKNIVEIVNMKPDNKDNFIFDERKTYASIAKGKDSVFTYEGNTANLLAYVTTYKDYVHNKNICVAYMRTNIDLNALNYVKVSNDIAISYDKNVVVYKDKDWMILYYKFKEIL